MYTEEFPIDPNTPKSCPHSPQGLLGPGKVIGEGSYGTVYLVRDSQNKKFALKKIQLSEGEEGLSTAILRETSILFQFRHENIVKLLDWSYCYQGWSYCQKRPN